MDGSKLDQGQSCPLERADAKKGLLLGEKADARHALGYMAYAKTLSHFLDARKSDQNRAVSQKSAKALPSLRCLHTSLGRYLRIGRSTPVLVLLN